MKSRDIPLTTFYRKEKILGKYLPLPLMSAVKIRRLDRTVNINLLPGVL